MHNGWYQLAYERDLKPGLNALSLAGRPLLVVYREQAGHADVYDGNCPHRGYLLGVAGELRGDRVVCPFHGQAVGLGEPHGCALSVARHASLLVGGLLFARVGAGADAGFAERIAHLDARHYIVPGFTRRIRAPAELVVENAFDCGHFQPVHRIGNAPRMAAGRTAEGAYAAQARFELPPSAWQGAAATNVPFTTTAYSPTLVVTELGGARPYIMLSATVPVDPGICELRLSVMLPIGEAGRPPEPDGVRYLLRQAEAGIDKDTLVWENLADGGAIGQAAPFDGPVLGFRQFCEGFL